MKIVVTGASGYIGAEVLNYLRKKSVDCNGVARSSHLNGGKKYWSKYI